VEFIDGEGIFAEGSQHGIPGRDLFYEHVHMNPHGNYLLARELFSRAVARLPDDLRRAATSDVPSEEEANRLLALTPHDRRRVAQTVTAWLSQAPFTGRINNDEEVQAMRQEGEGQGNPEETSAAYRFAIDKAPQDRWLHFNYGLSLEARDPAAAAAEFRRALELLPNNYEFREKLVDALIKMKKYEEAIAQCQELLRQMPYHAPAYLAMAYAQSQLQSFDQSIASYDRAIKMQPSYASDAYNQIGIIQLHQGLFDAAIASFEKAMAANTSQVLTSELRYNLNYARQQQSLLSSNVKSEH
jgi:tetratricopeptide (TPR) repeat protein